MAKLRADASDGRDDGGWISKIPAGSSGSGIGFDVAISGDTAVVAEPLVNSHAGAAYIYELEGGKWRRAARLRDPRGVAGDFYAWAVAIYTGKHGSYVAIGGNDVNNLEDNIYIYQGSGKTWHLQAILSDPGGTAADMFGDSMAIDNTTLVVGASCYQSDDGEIWLWQRFNNTWYLQAKKVNPRNTAFDDFAESVAVSGNTAVVGAIGSTYIYTYSASKNWTLTTTLHSPGPANDNFGESVAISGKSIVIGAPGGIPDTLLTKPLRPGAAYVYRSTGKSWSRPVKLTAPAKVKGHEFGASVAIANSRLLVGAPAYGKAACGSAYLFKPAGTGWSAPKLVANRQCGPNDQFGASVGLSGNTGVIGAPITNNYQGAVYFQSFP